jgi:FHS family L-fucose permease-like MFS transporter
MNQQKQNGNLVAIVTMFFIFAMISFVTNLAAPIGTIWGNKFEGNSVLGMMGNMMNFLAYLFMGIPAGNMLINKGYKKTALIAMAVGAIGLFVQYLSSVIGTDTSMFTLNITQKSNDIEVVREVAVTLNYFIYLLGAFICGFSVCMLNTVVNPMLNMLGGGGNKGNQLIQAGGALNSLSGTLTPLFVGSLIGSLTKNTTIGDVAPLLWIAIGIFVIAFIVISFVTIPEPHMHKADEKAVVYEHSPWSFRHTTLGVIGIFIYVGIEIGIPGILNIYLSNYEVSGLPKDTASAIAGATIAIYWLLMLVGRTLSSAISGKVSTRTQLIAVSSVAIVLVLCAIFSDSATRVSMPGYSVDNGFTMANVPINALYLVLCGLCTSIMWGGIFNLAVEGLGKYTAQASGIFMMMVVGGGVLPLIQSGLADAIGYMNSYWLIVAALAYMLYYGLAGCKNVNKNIPVD